jgi:hypothetical protein
MNSAKSDVIKHSQAKGATSGENEPLFPRLHINETEKAGPRAPPRNKMALYEQLTVPSHRFVQRSGTTNTNSHQEHQVNHPFPSCTTAYDIVPQINLYIKLWDFMHYIHGRNIKGNVVCCLDFAGSV